MSPYWAMSLASASTHWYVPMPIAANIADMSRKIEYLVVYCARRKKGKERREEKEVSESRPFDPLSEIIVALPPSPLRPCRWPARGRASGTQRIIKSSSGVCSVVANPVPVPAPTTPPAPTYPPATSHTSAPTTPPVPCSTESILPETPTEI